MANFEAFRWNFSLSTNPEIWRSDKTTQNPKIIQKQMHTCNSLRKVYLNSRSKRVKEECLRIKTSVVVKNICIYKEKNVGEIVFMQKFSWVFIL